MNELRCLAICIPTCAATCYLLEKYGYKALARAARYTWRMLSRAREKIQKWNIGE